MERHRSQPYNPNIANGFFRAGYVETWGRGIEKICEACKKHGVPLPEYKIHLEDIMVKFTPLLSSKVPKEQNGTLSGILFFWHFGRKDIIDDKEKSSCNAATDCAGD